MERVTWWIDRQTLDAIRRAAQADGRSVSAWVRRALSAAAMRQEETQMAYRVETRGTDGQWTGNLGDGPNEFGSHAEAGAAIESLRALGGEWAAAEYRIIAVGAEGRGRAWRAPRASLWIEGGYHNASRIEARPTQRMSDGQMAHCLSAGQVDRLQAHLCGVAGCECGGVWGPDVRAHIEGIYAEPERCGLTALSDGGARIEI